MSRSYRRRLSEPAGMTSQMRIDADTFGRRLAALLAERGMNQSDFARQVWGETVDEKGYRTAKGRDRISDYVNGRALPSPKLLKEMADALGMAQEDLAPDLATGAAAREKPAIAMSSPSGRPDLMHVQVDMLIPSELAPDLLTLLNKAKAATRSS
jgi:transcriptional regulator with XRE-family HTH domain